MILGSGCSGNAAQFPWPEGTEAVNQEGRESVSRSP
jgi:hypothetical protein